jgi:hypothetical protein
MPPLMNRSQPYKPQPQTSAKKIRSGVRLIGLLFTLLFLVVGLLVLVNHQSIEDYLRLRHYDAPPVISQLATQDTMTAYARKVFYVNSPTIEDKAVFSQNCPNDGGEKTIVLGCYHSNQQGIFLLNVTDNRLNGVEQVTAAHETLHAIYDRLSSKERATVDAMLLNYYDHDLTDPRIKQTIAAYKQSEPNDVVNEMHSVFGTEVPNLPPALENYYKKYFTNRAAITAYAATYQSEFITRQTEVAQDDAQLNIMKTSINDQQSDLTNKLAAITTQQTKLQQEKNSGDITDYNAGVPNYNSLIVAYNSEVTSLQALINQYNTLVNTRNSVALQEQQLQNDLAGSPATIQ